MKYLLFLLTFNIFANSNLVGTYNLDVDISGTQFSDVLTITKATANYSHHLFPTYNLEGFFEVPGVFKVPIEGEYKHKCESILKADLSSTFHCYNFLDINFVAIENGKSFPVELFAMIDDEQVFSGSLSSNGNSFAFFTATKSDDHESSN
jgi:hypothetical protein